MYVDIYIYIYNVYLSLYICVYIYIYIYIHTHASRLGGSRRRCAAELRGRRAILRTEQTK